MAMDEFREINEVLTELKISFDDGDAFE